MTGDTLSVVVVDDQPVILAGLRAMLDAEPDLSVTAVAVNGRDAIAVAGRIRPDVVLMDIRMPTMDGIEATRRIVASRTAGAVVMITTFDDEAYLLESVRAGASGFLLKDAGPALLAAAVRSAAQGDALIDPAMTKALLERRLADAPARQELTRRRRSLSDRECEVLAAIARGLTNAEMAAEMYLSEATIKTHISNVLSKTGSRSRVAAAVFAYESGFIRPGEASPS